MNIFRNARIGEWLLVKPSLLPLLSAMACLSFVPNALANITIWDTAARFGDSLSIDDRTGWKAVPSDLLALEADPAKATSDPGYYGREYSFKGDAVVENGSLTAVFWSAKGRVAIYSKDCAAPSSITSSASKSSGRKIAELSPLQTPAQPTSIARCEIVRNAGDEAVLTVYFSTNGAVESSAVFSFGKTEIVEIKPSENMKGVSVLSSIEYGIAPGFVVDDLLFVAGDYPSLDTLEIPARNLFVGLLAGEESEWVMTWPKGSQRLALRLGEEKQGKRTIEAVDFHNDGQSLFLAGLAAPGIWHRERLLPAYLEKDVPIQWKRPFPAKWTTQLLEGSVKTAFAFRPSKGQIWRGVPGSYQYPVWFDGETAMYHLSKKVPPKGDSIVYFLEGDSTPPAISTPVDIMKAALGRPFAGELLDIAGRKLRTHHRRGGEGVRRACTCGGTEAIQAVFESGSEADKKEFIEGAANDMLFFVQRHVERIEEYKRFTEELAQYLHAQASASPELKPFLDSLEQIAEQLTQEYNVQKENMQSVAHAKELVRQTQALALKKDPNNLKACIALVKAWTAMGGAQDYVLAQCHTLTRKLDQAAGYGCVSGTKAAAVAGEVRKRCRQCLRNPDGYEIWANY
jgi:hypothetical protein